MKMKSGILAFLAILAIILITCNRTNGTTQQSTVSETAVITSTENYAKILAQISNEDLFDFTAEIIWVTNYGTLRNFNYEVYKKTLLNETGFYTSNNKITYLHDLNFSLFAVVDMRENGIPELVLHNASNGDSLVLHYYDGVLYGKEYGYRAMRNLKTDGSFAWSNSAFNSGLDILWFSGADQETLDLAEYDSLREDAESSWTLIERYRIFNQPVSQEDFYAYTAIQDAKEDVVWYELTIENINNLDALLKMSAILFPPPIDYFQYNNFKPMNSVNVLEDLRLWGWSKNSNVAYTIKTRLEPMEGEVFTAVIFNTIDDTVIYRNSINSNNFKGNYNAAFNNLIDNFKNKALQNGIEYAKSISIGPPISIPVDPCRPSFGYTKADFKGLPIRDNNQTVNIIVETYEKTGEWNEVYGKNFIEIFGDNWNEIFGNIVSYKIIAERDGRRKTVHEKIPDRPVMNVVIYGYFISPFEDRALIVAGEYVWGFEGYDVRYFLIGCHLSTGFSNRENE